jgi:K+-transporting ATPase ATPase C chain
MRRQLLTGLLMTVVLTVLLGLLYPLAVTGVSQVAFAARADGSLVRSQGRVVGSSLLGQDFTGRRWFHPRPSAGNYDGLASGGSNLGPSSPDLRQAVTERAAAYRAENGLPSSADVPVDAVTASASGLDPDISVANARLQAPRIAAARHLAVTEVLRLVDAHTQHRQWGVLGEDAVNVLELNLALDRQA